jgi:hypothetical protein
MLFTAQNTPLSKGCFSRLKTLPYQKDAFYRSKHFPIKGDAFHGSKHPRIEELINQFLKRRIDGVEPLHVRSTSEMVGDIVQILDFDFGVPALFGIQNDIGTLLASAKAHVRFNLDVHKALSSDSFLQLSHELLGTPRFAVNVLTNETDPLHRNLLRTSLLAKRFTAKPSTVTSLHLHLSDPVFAFNDLA